MKNSIKKVKITVLGFILCLSPLLFIACSKSDSNNTEIGGSYSNLENVILIPEEESGYGGYYYQVYTPFVFFKNGRFIRAPYIPVNQLNADKYIEGQGEAVGAWTASNGKVEITFDSGRKRTYDWPGYLGYAPSKGQTISGSFESISGGGTIAVGGDIGIMNYSNMSFTDDGWYTTENVNGTQSSTNTAFHTSKTSGKYVINTDFSITLKANNGQETKLFFCWYSKSLTGTFRLAGRTFSPES